jgi:hypothetical protein
MPLPRIILSACIISIHEVSFRIDDDARGKTRGSLSFTQVACQGFADTLHSASLTRPVDMARNKTSGEDVPSKRSGRSIYLDLRYEHLDTSGGIPSFMPSKPSQIRLASAIGQLFS